MEHVENAVPEPKKILRFFGGDFCPYSNTGSHAYKVTKEFEDKYGDKVDVLFYWSGKDNDTMKQYEIKFLPTLLNGTSNKVELKLPEGTETDGKSEDYLRDLLFEHLYNNL